MGNQTECPLGGGAAARAITRRCCASVPSGGFSSYACGKPAKHEHLGKWYCGIHNPARVLAKRLETDRKRSERREAETAVRNAAREAREALERNAARYLWLRDVGDATWFPMAKRPGCSAALIDSAIDAAMREPVCGELSSRSA